MRKQGLERAHTNDVTHSAAVAEAPCCEAAAIVDAVGVEISLGQRERQVVVVPNVHK